MTEEKEFIFEGPGLTPEELAERLKGLGAKVGSWDDLPGNMASPVGIDRQRDLLVKMRDILQGVVDKDQEEVLRCREKIARLKHGGGV